MNSIPLYTYRLSQPYIVTVIAIVVDVSPTVSFLPSYNRVERFDFVDDNNAIVCPYKCTSIFVSVCLSLDDEKV